MSPRVYLETTIISYLTARPSRDLVVAAHQALTREWWERRRSDFGLVVSELVVQEAGAGDAEAARRRLELVAEVPRLAVTAEAEVLAGKLVSQGAIPTRAAADALHIALATVHEVEYLLTWNCAHIANAELRAKVESICVGSGYSPPVICTPEELLGE